MIYNRQKANIRILTSGLAHAHLKAAADVEADEKASVLLMDAFIAAQEVAIHSAIARLALKTADTTKFQQDLEKQKQLKMEAARMKFESSSSTPILAGLEGNAAKVPYVMRRVGSESSDSAITPRQTNQTQL